MGDQEDPHDHVSDDSCSTRREDDDREGFGHIETDQGLTLQSTEQSSDAQQPGGESSMTDAELQHFLWELSDVDNHELPFPRPWRARTSTPSPTPPDFWLDPEPQPSTEQQPSDVPAPRSDQEENSASPTTSVTHPPFSKNPTKASQQPVQSDCFGSGSQPSTEQQSSNVPAPRSDQEKKTASRTSSVSHPPSGKNQTKASRTPSPAQSDCFASGPQTPERSETPPTPIENGNASCELSGDDVETHETSEVDHQRHPVAIGAAFTKSHSLTGDGACQDTQGPFQKIPVVDLTEESRITSSLSSRQRYAYLRASSTWNCNTPIPSIEGHRLLGRTLPSAPNSPSKPQLTSQSNTNSAGSRLRRPEHIASVAQRQRGQIGEVIAKNGEIREKEPLYQYKQSTPTTTNSSTTQSDPSSSKFQYKQRTHTATNSSAAQSVPSSQFFSTFMKLRNSLPLSAAMAMMAPANQSQVLSTLAELSNAQGFANQPGIAQTASHEVPAAMRGMLDNLKRKFDSDKSFLQSVIVYVTEQLIEDDTNKEQPLDESDPKHGLDGLRTLPAALEQLVNERKQSQTIITNLENMLKKLVKERQQNRMIIGNLKNILKKSKAKGDSVPKNPTGLSFPTPSDPSKYQQPPVQSTSSKYQQPQVQSASPVPYVSPYATDGSRKRKASETLAPSSPKKAHPGYAFAPSKETKNAIRRALPPLKEWMKEGAKAEGKKGEKGEGKGEGKGVEVEVIEVESDTDDDALASLFGEDDGVVGADDTAAAVEADDDAAFEADMYEALDWALSERD